MICFKVVVAWKWQYPYLKYNSTIGMCGDSALLAVECVKLFHNLIIICLNSLETLVLLSMSMEALRVPLT